MSGTLARRHGKGEGITERNSARRQIGAGHFPYPPGDMVIVRFTSALHRHTECPETEVEADTVRAALDAVFARTPALRGYILDDQGALRPHILVFVDGAQATDRQGLAHGISAESQIDVMQALSGG